MSAREIEEIDEIILEVFESQFGFRAGHREVFQAVLEVVDRNYEVTGVNRHLVKFGFHKWVSGRVTAVFNRRQDGLPFAPVVNEKKQHVPVDHATFSELDYLARGYVRRGKAEYSQAYRVGARAREVYERDIVIDGINLSAEARAA